MRQYVERGKREPGQGRWDTFLPLSCEWGTEAQVNWFEIFASLEGERNKKRFWKPTSWGFIISEASSSGFTTKTRQVR
jgi:hypothetical protein